MQRLTKAATVRRSARTKLGRTRSRARVEPLEARTLLATFAWDLKQGTVDGPSTFGGQAVRAAYTLDLGSGQVALDSFSEAVQRLSSSNTRGFPGPIDVSTSMGKASAAGLLRAAAGRSTIPLAVVTASDPATGHILERWSLQDAVVTDAGVASDGAATPDEVSASYRLDFHTLTLDAYSYDAAGAQTAHGTTVFNAAQYLVDGPSGTYGFHIEA